MIKVNNQLQAGKYTVLCLNEHIPLEPYSKVVVSGVEYETEIVYDMPNSVGIVAKGNFVGKEVQFI